LYNQDRPIAIALSLRSNEAIEIGCVVGTFSSIDDTDLGIAKDTLNF
ncbi:4433_t:CDS:2, partial [Racocetra fulgida]